MPRSLLLLALGCLLPACGNTPATPPPDTVERVDVERYLGDWFEIARLPNRFQDQCAGDVTASYARDPGAYDLLVTNRCRRNDGTLEQADGRARILAGSNNTRLEVSFFSILGWRPAWGDYWVIGLDPGYQWAIVGSPDREYGWILSRSPRLEAATREKIDAILAEKGYEPDSFIDTPQQP